MAKTVDVDRYNVNSKASPAATLKYSPHSTIELPRSRKRRAMAVWR